MSCPSQVTRSSDLQLPRIGLGTWSLRGEQCINAVCGALQCGYRLIDTASFYGNEKEVGEAVRCSGLSREKVIIQTKLYPDQYDQASKAIDDALKKLNLDYIDIMMLHHPAKNDVSAYRAIEQAIAKQKVRAAGLSCYYIQETDAFLPQVDIQPVLIQNEIHPFYQDKAVVKHLQSLGIAVQSWYPFGGRGHAQELFQNSVLLTIARTYGKTVAQVILRWHLQRGVTVIPGSCNQEHIKENLAIFDFQLSQEDMQKIKSLDRNEKHDWY